MHNCNSAIHLAVVKVPPFQVAQSGSSSFTLPIKVYIRNNNKITKTVFEYNLILPSSNVSCVNRIRMECLTLTNSNDDFQHMKFCAGGSHSDHPFPLSLPEKKQGNRPFEMKWNERKKMPHTCSDSFNIWQEDSDVDGEMDEEPSGKDNAILQRSSWGIDDLRKLHKHLNSLQDCAQRQQVVDIIISAGQQTITELKFEFDVCKLDDMTLTKLANASKKFDKKEQKEGEPTTGCFPSLSINPKKRTAPSTKIEKFAKSFEWFLDESLRKKIKFQENMEDEHNKTVDCSSCGPTVAHNTRYPENGTNYMMPHRQS